MNMRGTATLLALIALPCALAAQDTLRIDAGGRSAKVGAVRTAAVTGFAAIALTHLGASVATTVDGARAVLFGDTLVFTIGSPFFLARAAVQPLAHPVGHANDDAILPAQFFTDWLPRAYPDRARYANGTLTVSGPIAFAPPPAPPGQTKRVVVIDPGHGGDDDGKIGPNGLREKDAALALSKRIATLLTDKGYEVHLTRTTDTLVALDDRPRLANRWKNSRPAAIFVSIHMNSTATGARTARGFETFFLSAAQTEDEQRVAEMENAAAEFEDGPSTTLSEADIIVNGLLNDYYVRASSDLADALQRGMAGVHTGPDRGVKRAGFRVLVGALMPAVLVEVAFISHPAESRLVGQTAFQQTIAQALADAVIAFFDGHEHLWRGGQ